MTNKVDIRKVHERPWLKTCDIPGNTGTIYWMYSVALRYR